MKGNTLLTVLVAATGESIHSHVEEISGSLAIRVISAFNVKDFFKKLREHEFDLIIFDAELPSMKAPEAFAIARTFYPGTPAVLLHGDENYDLAKAMIDKGIIYRMLKPVDYDDLELIIDHVHGQKSKALASCETY